MLLTQAIKLVVPLYGFVVHAIPSSSDTELLTRNATLVERAPLPSGWSYTCSPHGTSIDKGYNAFDQMANHLSWDTCGGVWAPTLWVNANSLIRSYSDDSSTQFWVCNRAGTKHCISIDSTKKDKLRLVGSGDCVGKGFWITEPSVWAWGIDPQGYKECGNK